MSELVTVFRSRSPFEAQMVRNAFEAAGLTCHVQGDQQGGYSGMFDIHLVVDARDESLARDLLEEFRANASLEPDSESGEDGEEGGAEGED